MDAEALGASRARAAPSARSPGATTCSAGHVLAERCRRAGASATSCISSASSNTPIDASATAAAMAESRATGDAVPFGFEQRACAGETRDVVVHHQDDRRMG